MVCPPSQTLRARLPLTARVRKPTQRRTHHHQPLTCPSKRGNFIPPPRQPCGNDVVLVQVNWPEAPIAVPAAFEMPTTGIDTGLTSWTAWGKAPGWLGLLNITAAD